MPELNFNLLAPNAELYSGPDVKLDPMAAYEAARTRRDTNTLAQLYAKHYDPQTGGVNYNALIPEAAQSGVDVSKLMGDVQKQAKSQADIAQTRALQQQEEATAAAKEQERKQAEMLQHAKESYMRLQGVNTPDQFWAWHLSNPELPGVDKESLSADVLEQISTPEGFQRALANSKKALEGITGIKADEGIWKDATDRWVQIDPVSGKEINSIKKGASPTALLNYELKKEQLESKKPSVEAVMQVADMIQAGMSVPMGTSSEFRAAVFGELRNRGASGKELASAQAALMGQKQAERTLGGLEARQAAAGSETEVMIPIAREYDQIVGNRSFKSFNEFTNWAGKQTGNKAVVQLNSALNAVVNSYARAIAPTGIPAQKEKERAYALLDSALQSGQINAVLDVMEQEISAARRGTAAAKTEIRGQTSTPPAAGGGAKTPTKSLDDIFKKKTP